MKAGTFIIFRFTAAIATVGLVAAHPYLPAKKLLLLPAENTTVAINGYVNPITGASASTWIDRTDNHWRCNFEPQHTLNNPCGFSIRWGDNYATATAGSHSNSQPACGDAQDPDSAQRCHSDAVATERICDSPDADRDGNGLGWDSVGICRAEKGSRVAGPSMDGGTQPICPVTAVDLDGDGKSFFGGVECLLAEGGNDAPAQARLPAPRPARGRIFALADAAESQSAAPESIDFSRYRGINLTLAYEGSSPFLRVYLQNYNPAYARPDRVHSNKFMSRVVLAEDLKAGTAFIGFDGFNVSEWWIREYEIPREWSQPEFDRIVGMGIDLVQFGVHKVKVERIELVGERIQFATLLMGLALFWLLYLAAETLLQFALMRRRAQRGEAEIDLLSQAAQILEEEKRALAKVAVTDALTGAPNRAGLAQQIRLLAERGGLDERTGVIVVDIDHFKRINDTYGHDLGDAILKELAETLAVTIRRGDLLARWGGEEFVLVCPDCPQQQLIRLAEHLRIAIGQHRFTSANGLQLTVSLGATHCRAGENFDHTFRRADLALFEAKAKRDATVYKAPVPPEVTR